MTILQAFALGFCSLFVLYFVIAVNERGVLPKPPQPSLWERPPRWQPPEAHAQRMKRIAALPIPSYPPRLRPEYQRFGVRYRILPQGPIHEAVILATDLDSALDSASRLDVGIMEIVEIAQPPLSELAEQGERQKR